LSGDPKKEARIPRKKIFVLTSKEGHSDFTLFKVLIFEFFFLFGVRWVGKDC
jgi:hypothetical protein